MKKLNMATGAGGGQQRPNDKGKMPAETPQKKKQK